MTRTLILVHRWDPRTRISALFRDDLNQSLQLNLSTTVTLGTEESDSCREVEARLNVWTVRQKRWLLSSGVRCREVQTRVNVWHGLSAKRGGCCREV